MQYALSFLLAAALCLTPACSKSNTKASSEIIQKSVLADTWYTHDAKKLSDELNSYFTLAEKHFALNTDNTSLVQALVVPHAAYYYSGLCAATAYQSLLKPAPGRFSFGTRKNTAIKRVVILAPNHTMFHQGIALPYCNVFETTLGKITVDTEAIKQLSKKAPFVVSGEAYLHEHAVEMQLPFLQSTVDSFKIVPLIIGHLTPEHRIAAAHALHDLVDDKTLIVVSTDFTHFGQNYGFQPFMKHKQLNIRKVDSFTLQALSVPSLAAFEEVLQATKTTVCGQEPLRILLTLFDTKKYAAVHAETSCYYTSAQITAARDKLSDEININGLRSILDDKQAEQSVSYAGIIYRKTEAAETKPFSFNAFEKTALLTSARAAIENHFQEHQIPEQLLYPVITPAFENNPGVFVSLKIQPEERLRGCIGHVTTEAPLYKSVRDLSLAAAFGDNRFLPLAPGELAHITIELSLLTPPRPISSPQEIVLGKHGIILEKRDRDNKVIGAALFLPGVAREYKWTLDETLTELSMKAGLLPNSWREDTSFSVFEDYEIKEIKESAHE